MLGLEIFLNLRYNKIGEKMNYRFLKKLFIIIVILLMGMIPFPKKSLAADSLGNIISAGDSFIATGTDAENKLKTTDMKNFSDTIYSVLLTLGIILAVVFAVILGIQYMMAAAEDKAQIKEAMIPFIVGCIIIFGAFAIWKALVTVLS